MTATPRLDERSKDLRRVIVRILQKARRGHVGAAYSLIEILRVLYDDVLRFNPQNPKWKDRDRCILSKGHGCLALYALLADKGFFADSELEKFCTADGILGGHPDAGKVPGVEASTGALGHGLPIGLGMATICEWSSPMPASSSSSATANATRVPSGKRPCAPANTA